jgi:hypothetical protein
MSESEETKWRLSPEIDKTEENAEVVTASLSEDEQKKDELQQRIQTKAENIGGGEGSHVTRPEEVRVAEAPRKQKGTKPNLKYTARRKRESDTNNISKQLKRQADQLTRIEKVILPLQKSVNRIEKQSNTIKQLYSSVTYLQRHVHLSQNRKPKTKRLKKERIRRQERTTRRKNQQHS